MIPSRRWFWFVQTWSRAWTGLGRFLLVLVPISVVFAAFRVSTGAVDFSGLSGPGFLVTMALLFANLYLGSFLLAAIVGPDPKPRTKRYLLGWAAAGALVVPGTLATASLVDGATGNQGFAEGPFFWLFLFVTGAMTGLAYGHHARKWPDEF